MKTEQLWISDDGKIVCERASCAGEDLVRLIIAGRGLEFNHKVGGYLYSRLSKIELAELAPLIAGTDGHLQCDGGHVRYDMRAQVLREVKVTA